MNCMVFSTFDWDQLGKILQHSWKKYLKISSKVVNFESDLLKTNEEIALQRREIYIHWMVVAGGGGGGGPGAASSYPPSFPPLMASLQKVEGSILCKILLDQTGVKLFIFLGKEWTVINK